MQQIMKGLENLNYVMIGALRRHQELFSFKTEGGIDYLSLHVGYVI